MTKGIGPDRANPALSSSGVIALGGGRSTPVLLPLKKAATNKCKCKKFAQSFPLLVGERRTGPAWLFYYALIRLISIGT